MRPATLWPGIFTQARGGLRSTWRAPDRDPDAVPIFFPRMICWCNFCLLVWIGCSSRSCGWLVPGTDPEYKWLCHKGKQDISSPAHSSYTQLNWRQGTPSVSGCLSSAFGDGSSWPSGSLVWWTVCSDWLCLSKGSGFVEEVMWLCCPKAIGFANGTPNTSHDGLGYFCMPRPSFLNLYSFTSSRISCQQTGCVDIAADKRPSQVALGLTQVIWWVLHEK